MKRFVISFLTLLLMTGCVTAMNPAAFARAADKEGQKALDSGDALSTFVANYNTVAEDLITSEGVTVEQLDESKVDGNILEKENHAKVEFNYNNDSLDCKEEIANVMLIINDTSSFSSGELTGELCCLIAGMTGRNKTDSVAALKELMNASGGATEYFSYEIDGFKCVFAYIGNMISLSINKPE